MKDQLALFTYLLTALAELLGTGVAKAIVADILLIFFSNTQDLKRKLVYYRQY